jgi:hypothetical protein
LKRRTQFLISGFGMLTIFATQTLCAGLFNQRGNAAAGNAVIAMLFLFYAFYNLAFNALLYSYPVEVLPYPIRAKGFAVLMFSGKGKLLFQIAGFVVLILITSQRRPSSTFLSIRSACRRSLGSTTSST